MSTRSLHQFFGVERVRDLVGRADTSAERAVVINDPVLASIASSTLVLTTTSTFVDVPAGVVIPWYGSPEQLADEQSSVREGVALASISSLS